MFAIGLDQSHHSFLMQKLKRVFMQVPYPSVWSFFVVIFFYASPVVSIRKTRLTWINGIGHNLDHMHQGQIKISKLFGGKEVLFCHNPTAMANEDDVFGYVGDLAQAGTQKLGRISKEVNMLVTHLKDAIAQVGKKGLVVHIAHSQGALVTYLAAKQLSPLEMNQIEVIAFGGAAALRRTPQTPFHRCVNYYSVNDPLLFIVPSAEQALRSGCIVDEEFCFLAPRNGDPIKDHHLFGSTYAQALTWEGQRFQQMYQSTAFRTWRFIILFLITLFHTIWNKVEMISQPILVKLLPILLLLWKWLETNWVQPVRSLYHKTAMRT